MVLLVGIGISASACGKQYIEKSFSSFQAVKVIETNLVDSCTFSEK